MKKSTVLTNSGQSVHLINIYQNIRDLTPESGSQKNPAKSG